MSAYDFIEKRFSDPNIDLYDIIKLMEDYATECILASLDEASESAELDFVDDEPIYGYVGIKKESITNPENIILL